MMPFRRDMPAGRVYQRCVNAKFVMPTKGKQEANWTVIQLTIMFETKTDVTEIKFCQGT